MHQQQRVKWFSLQPGAKHELLTMLGRGKIGRGGQSLLEIVVLVGLATVIVTGLTIVTITGLKNSQFSQNQAQATRLAQDAIDKIRTMKDQNCPVCIGGTGSACTGGTNYYWYDDTTYPSQIWSQNLNSASFRFVSNVNCGPAQPGGIGLQTPAAAGNLDDSIPTSLQATFSRQIILTDRSVSQKQIKVTVSWTDLSGTHQSSLAGIVGGGQ